MTLPKKQLLNTSEAIALTINRLNVGVVSAYPITPQTKIVEKLASLKDAGLGHYEFVRAESEFGAASVVLGATATGVRAYTATSSQGLLMMLEVLFNIAGLNLPVVMTCANRSLSAPLNIWNDHSDAMTLRDAGWLMFFAENCQEAVDQHVLAYKLAETLNIPAVINVDGFILTHMSEPVSLPELALLKKFLPKPKASANHLNPAKPESLGHLVGPKDFFKFKQQQNQALAKAIKAISLEYQNYLKLDGRCSSATFDNGLVEFYGSLKAKTVIVAMGSVIGTIKAAVDEHNQKSKPADALAVLKVKSFRPFDSDSIRKLLGGKKVVVINKAISAGSLPPLSLEIVASLNSSSSQIHHIVAGLGGQDIKTDDILKLAKNKQANQVIFLE